MSLLRRWWAAWRAFWIADEDTSLLLDRWDQEQRRREGKQP